MERYASYQNSGLPNRTKPYVRRAKEKLLGDISLIAPSEPKLSSHLSAIAPSLGAVHDLAELAPRGTHLRLPTLSPGPKAPTGRLSSKVAPRGASCGQTSAKPVALLSRPTQTDSPKAIGSPCRPSHGNAGQKGQRHSMRPESIASGPHRREVVLELGDLTSESLRILWPVTLAAAYLWSVAVIVFAESHSPWIYPLLVVLGCATWASRVLIGRNSRWAVTAYLSGLAISFSLITLQFSAAPPLFLFTQMVLVAAVLVDPRVFWAVAVGALALMLGLGIACDLPAQDMALPIGFVVFAALVSWVGTRRLHTALTWALSMTRRSQRAMEEARLHRAELQRAHKSLDEAYVRLEHTNHALLIARDAAHKAYQFKTDFVNNVSHELRTPLNLIVGFSEMMATAPESYEGVPMPDQYRGDVLAVYRSAKHLEDLTNDVLDLSQIESRMMPLHQEPTDIAQVAEDAVAMVSGLAEARGLAVELQITPNLPVLPLDQTRIRQVLLNLLTNALRFTTEGAITVTVRQEDDMVLVCVGDTGSGISEDKIDRAFHAFEQLDVAKAHEGSGLGLAISKRFVELHGGRMWIESRLGQGTTVSFSLALPESPKIAYSPLVQTPARQPASAKPCALVLHRDPRAAETLGRHIARFRFLAATDAAQVARLLEEEVPVVIVADAGEESLGRQVSPSCAGRVPLPVITTQLPSNQSIGSLMGAADFLPKPVTGKALSEALSRLKRRPSTVLVVDDDVHMVRLLTRMLKAQDKSLRVLKAFGGKAALDTYDVERPDTMLLDLQMPGTDGYAVLSALEARGELGSTQIIVVSVRPVKAEQDRLNGRLSVECADGFSVDESLAFVEAALSVLASSARGRQAIAPECRAANAE